MPVAVMVVEYGEPPTAAGMVLGVRDCAGVTGANTTKRRSRARGSLGCGIREARAKG
jgi:hypothetical protein